MWEINDELLSDQEKLLEALKENDNELKQLRSEMEGIQKSQHELFSKKAEELKPIIEFWKGKYFFTHPTIQYRSRKGPILDLNKDKGLLYVYDYDNAIVSVFNTYNMKEEKQEPFWRFFGYCDFDNVMTGLLYVKELQVNLIDGYTKSIEEEREKLERYL
ncbi:MAG: hypothetical protein LRY73_09825 [Bacillus sp. (in: Bacteria)]|nr:hypothetical protein [Bacillus sp. (in: firmicutes)]